MKKRKIVLSPVPSLVFFFLAPTRRGPHTTHTRVGHEHLRRARCVSACVCVRVALCGGRVFGSLTHAPSPNPPSTVLGALALAFSLGALLQVLGCALWHNWWPALTAFSFVLLPMPSLFLSDGFSVFGLGGANSTGGWVDAGRFLTGAAGVGCVATPLILWHAGKIAGGAALFELASVGVLAATLAAYEALTVGSTSGGYSFY